MSYLFLQTASPLGGLMPLFLVIAIMFVFMVLPQRRKAKKQEVFVDEIRKGDEVVTASGIIGRVDKIEDKIVTLNLGNKTMVRFTKNAISRELTHAIFPPKSAE